MSNKFKVKKKLPPELKRVQKKLRKAFNAPVKLPHPDDPREQARVAKAVVEQARKQEAGEE